MTKEEIIEAIKGMSVLELNDLVKAIEEEFGVTAAAPVAVSPVEVESVLLRQGGVHAAAVVEELDKNGLPGPCAFIVCGDEASNKVELESSLKLLAEQSLARFKRPRRYLFVSELPYTATGKVQRFKLREQLRK